MKAPLLLTLTLTTAILLTSCVSTPPAPYLGNRVEHVERMGPVDDVPYTGDEAYLRAAQDYSIRGRSNHSRYYYPY